MGGLFKKVRKEEKGGDSEKKGGKGFLRTKGGRSAATEKGLRLWLIGALEGGGSILLGEKRRKEDHY